MNKLYKTTLALFLSTHALLWAADEQKSYNFKEDSMCFFMEKAGDLSKLDSFYGKEKHRGVSFDGGGIRGLMEALWAVSIEEAANKEYAELKDDTDKKDFLEKTGIYKRRNITDNNIVPVGDIRFQDFFDFSSGTSTGSICAAALFHKDRFRATELLNLYLNLSVELFDLQKQPSGTKGYYTSKYNSNGLTGLLRAYFGESKMGNAFGNKKVYFGLTNEATHSLELVTNQDVDYIVHPGCIQHYVDHTLVDMISTSCAAPTFFDAKDITTIANESNQFCDGGLSANSPGDVALASEKRMERYTTEMYAFGTGGCGAYSVRAKNSGAYEVEKLMSTTLTANTEKSINSLKSEISDSKSLLKKLFRINAELSESEQKLDDTSPAYLGLLMEKAYECTQTKVFENMMESLGLNPEKRPDLLEITKRVNSLDRAFFDKVERSNEQFNSKEDYLLRSCLRRVCALDEEWFAPTSIVNIMDQNGVLSSKNSDDFLKNLQEYGATSKNNKANSVLKDYFSAKEALEKISPLNEDQFKASLTENAIENAKAELQKKAQNSSLYTALNSGAKFSSNMLGKAMTFLNYDTTTQNPAAEEDPILENEDANTALNQENASANFNRDNPNQTAIENDIQTEWTDGDVSVDDKSMWHIMNNYLAYLSDAGIKDTSCSNLLSIASTLYVNTLFQNISKDDLGKFHEKLQDLTKFLENEKPLSQLTNLCLPALKTLTMGFITGGTRLTSLLEAVQKRIDNKPCLENSISEIPETPETNDEAANAGKQTP